MKKTPIILEHDRDDGGVCRHEGTITRIADGLELSVSKTPMSGPAQVATAAYRTGWENIFGAKQEVGQA